MKHCRSKQQGVLWGIMLGIMNVLCDIEFQGKLYDKMTQRILCYQRKDWLSRERIKKKNIILSSANHLNCW